MRTAHARDATSKAQPAGSNLVKPGHNDLRQST
jgi:hypothetical protein